MIGRILNWFYPPHCIACKVMLPLNTGNFYICERCEQLFEKVSPPFCGKCGSLLESPDEICASCFGKKLHFDSNEAGFLYDDLMRDLLHDMKFRRKRRIAEGLGTMWAKEIKLPHGDFVLVPLPMHRKKIKERGFNQAEVLAQAILLKAKKCTLPSTPVAGKGQHENRRFGETRGVEMLPLLKRVVDTPAQSGLHPKLREENVKDVFVVVDGYSVDGKTVVLIDDIYTTGASANECARVLKTAGAARVYVKTLSQTLRKPGENKI